MGLLIRGPLGCGECLAGKDPLARRLTLIHWTLIRMASPGLDATVVTLSSCHPLLLLRQFSLLHLNLCFLFYPSLSQVKLNKFVRLWCDHSKKGKACNRFFLLLLNGIQSESEECELNEIVCMHESAAG